MTGTPTAPSDVAGLEVTQAADEAALSYLNEPVQDNCQLAYAFARYGARIRAEVATAAADILHNQIAYGYDQPEVTEQCAHDKFRWEDCIACYDEALTEAEVRIRALAAPVETNLQKMQITPVEGEKR